MLSEKGIAFLLRRCGITITGRDRSTFANLLTGVPFKSLYTRSKCGPLLRYWQSVMLTTGFPLVTGHTLRVHPQGLGYTNFAALNACNPCRRASILPI